MPEIRVLERLSAQDHYSLVGDDLGWPWDIGVIAVLDAPELFDDAGRLRIDAVRTFVGSRLHRLPRFRQLLYRPRRGLGWPLWVDAPIFDLADHVRVLPLPIPAGEAELLAACEKVRQRRLDPAKPLWELWLLPGLPQQQVGLFMRMHHTIADGVAGVAALRALLDVGPDAVTEAAPVWTPAAMPSTGELLRDNLWWRIRGFAHTGSALAHPGRTVRGARAAWPTWRELFTEERAPRTSLNGPLGRCRRLALFRGRVDAAKQVAHAHGAKVNDVVLTAVGVGLRDLLRSRGEPVDGLVLRVMVPVSLHREPVGQARGNLDGVIVVPLPLGEPDPVRLLHLVAAETAARKNKPHPQAVSTGIFKFAVARRGLIRLSAHQYVLNLTVTNVPGPPVPLYLAGARLLEVFPVVAILGNYRLSVAVLSYAGQLNLTAVADADACPRHRRVHSQRTGRARGAVAAGDAGHCVRPGTRRKEAMDLVTEDEERHRRLLLALTTEHFTLQTARASTIADSNGRAALYLSTVSGAVVALAFIGQVAHIGAAFFLFALALLPTLVLLGVLTYLRLVQTAVEDLFCARAINRIRRHYVDLDPEGARWFLLTGCDDPAAVMVNMGLAVPGARHSNWHLLSHAASMVAVVTSIIGGVFVALAAHTLTAGRLPVAAGATIGILVSTAIAGAFAWHQARRWRAAEDSVPSRFPSPPPPMPPVRTTTAN